MAEAILKASSSEKKKREPRYPILQKYTAPMKKAEREIVGREEEIKRLYAALMRPELSNCLLLAEAGAGKTALVQGTMLVDKDRRYLEVDLAKMISDVNDSNEIAAKLKGLFDEVAMYVQAHNKELVLFIDEFHQVVQLSDAAVEALKPLLADSGTRGIKVICATTYKEFRQYIAPNQPLVERLQRFNINEPSKEVVISILRGMAKRYGVDKDVYGDNIYDAIYEYTNRYIPANAQPRKSILVLDAMIGWHRAEGQPLGMDLLAKVIYEAEGVNVAFSVDASSIKKELDAHVLAQEWATSIIEQQLQIAVAGLNDPTKPMSSFLFSGSTGTGKALADDTPIPVYDNRGYVPIGKLQCGDMVFSEMGQPVMVDGVFPQGSHKGYYIKFEDGSHIIANGEHIWTCRAKGTSQWYDMTTNQILESSVAADQWEIPGTYALNRAEASLLDDPYSVGLRVAQNMRPFVFPEEQLMGSIAQRYQAFCGIADGTPTIKGVYVFHSKSIWESFNILAKSLGMRVKVYSGMDAETIDDVYYTRVIESSEPLPLGIESIEPIGRPIPMTCIHVANPTHLFVAGYDHIVTHNTEMSKTLANVLFHDERRLIRFDMTEYANPDTLERFRRELTARVWERPYSIVMLDEIEKACAEVTRLLLQVLDDGRLMDENNREVSFINSYIILTTNAGNEIYKNIAQYNVDDSGSGKEMTKYLKLIKDSISGTTGDNRFPPELLGRIDMIVPFQPLSEKTMERIATMKLNKLRENVMKKHGVQLRIHKDVIRYLVLDNLTTDSDAGGARGVASKMQEEVTSAVARYINEHPRDKSLGVFVGGEMAVDNKYVLESTAYIDVRPAKAAIRG